MERPGRTKSEWGTTGLDSSTGDLNKDRVSATAEVGVGGKAEARYWSAKLTVEAAGEPRLRNRSENSADMSRLRGSDPKTHGSMELGVFGRI